MGKKNGKITLEKGKCHSLYSFCPLKANGKADDKHCRSVKKPCCHEPCKWNKVGDGHFETDGDDDGAAKKVKAVCKRLTLTFKPLKKNGKEKKEMKYWLCHDKHCKSVKKCGSGKGKWVKAGDDDHEHFEPKEGDHKHKKCKDGDDSDEDGDHKHKKCKHGDESGDESGGESDGDDDDDDKDEDGDKKKKRKCKKKHGSDGEDSDGSGDSGSDSDHKHGCKKHGSDDSGDDSD